MKPFTRRSKYKAKPTIYAGVRYPSKAEAAHAARLDLEIRAGTVLWWIRQVAFTLGVPENRMVVDFLVASPTNGPGVEMRVDEVKGRETEKYRHNRRLWASYGPVPLHVIRRGKTVEIVKPREATNSDV